MGSEDGDEELDPWRELIDAMADQVSETMLVGKSADPVLAILLDVTIASIKDERPLFPDLLHEPVLYRQFRRIVEAVLKSQEGTRTAPGEE